MIIQNRDTAIVDIPEQVSGERNGRPSRRHEKKHEESPHSY
jgi:hypothetical protein